ncbi:MAG TPA: hypothetical protein VEH84_04085 [Alphaproteobacteria bacterium]|nr:hypothetical protein [Alphaproteobacteria bacterium]
MPRDSQKPDPEPAAPALGGDPASAEAVRRLERRVQQLLGERDELRRRAAAIEGLLRQALSGGRPGLLRLLGRKPAAPARKEAPKPPDGALVPHLGRGGARVVGVALFGLSGEARDAAVALAAARCAAADAVPLFLTDDPDLTRLRRAGHLAEYFPAQDRQAAAPDLDWPLYRRRRLELLRRKWGLATIIPFGPASAWVCETDPPP